MRICAASLLALSLSLATGSAEEAFSDAKQAYATLRVDKARRNQRIHYEKLIKRLTDAAKGKSGQRADDCLYFAATISEDLHQASGVTADLEQAIKLNIRVADEFKGSSLADDALLRAARLMLSRKGDVQGARALLARARDGYPKGDQARAVRELLARLPEVSPEKNEGAEKARTELVSATPARRVSDDNSDGNDRVQEILARVAQRDAGPAVEAEAAKTTTPKVEANGAPMALKQGKGATTRRNTELTLKVDGPVEVSTGTVPAAGKLPPRFFVDIAPALTGTLGRDLRTFKDERVRGVRVAQFDERTVRVVIDLKKEVPANALHDAAQKKLTIWLGAPPSTPVQQTPPPAPELAAVEKAAPAEEATHDHHTHDEAPAAMPTVVANVDVDAPDAGSVDASLAEVKQLAHQLENRPEYSLSAQTGLKVRRVVIDPGHGGDDPGAIGPTGVKEKDVTLKIAKKIAQRLRKELKMEVFLTRERDVFIPLEERTAFANKVGADLFISIHCNSNPNRRIYGVETYYLNITDDNYSMRLAARENRTSQRSISDLQFILADLAMKSNVDDSVRLSKLVQANVVGELRDNYGNVKDLGVKHALFYVLIGAKMPAILVETSFISNKVEEQRLNSTRYQDEVADGVVQGVRHFVEERQALAR
ncbi:MAG: N-acetylmuramoyl-L-alanine amidase [Myxococcota bacterium]